MALAFDAVTTHADTLNETTHTFSHTCSGTNRLLIVALGDVSSSNVTGITYAGVALTKLFEVTDGGGFNSIEMWYLVNPASGANDVVISSGSLSVGGAAVSFSGVHQITPLGTHNTASGTGSTPTVNIASAAGDIVIDIVQGDYQSGLPTLTVDGSQTQRWNNNTGSFTATQAGSTETAAGATTTMSWSSNKTGGWRIGGVAIKAAQLTQALSGAVGSLSGTLAKKTNKSFAGATGAMSGTVAAAHIVLKSLAGAMGTLSGSLARQTNKALAGATGAMSGSLTRMTKKALAGATGALSGSLTSAKVFLVNLTGSLTMTGSVLLARVIPILGWRLRKSGERGWKYPRDGK